MSPMSLQMEEVTLINNHNYMSQVCDFTGLQWGTIYPTDIDGLIDYHNKAWIVLEFKHGSKECPYGQRLALERLVDDLQKSGKEALGLIARHDTSGDIKCADCIVDEWRFHGEWKKTDSGISVKNSLDQFIKLIDSGVMPTSRLQEEKCQYKGNQVQV